MATPLIETGTYTGVRPNAQAADITRVDCAFEPEMVIVVPETADAIAWKSDLCWSGKGQFFANLSSANNIGPRVGQIHHPFNGKGFSVTGNLNKAGETYHYIAIKANGSRLYREMSYIGNNVVGRALNWLDEEPDVVFVKRDGGGFDGNERSAIWRIAGGTTSIRSTYQGGTGGDITSITSTGITVSGARSVNESFGSSGLGEGINAVAFNFADGGGQVVAYTGDGNASQTIATTGKPAAVIVLDGVNNISVDTQRHAIATDTMTSGDAKAFDATAIGNSSVTLGDPSGFTVTDFNVSGRSYVAIVFYASTGTELAPVVRGDGKKAARLSRSNGRINLADNSIGTGDSSYMIHCRLPSLDYLIGTSSFLPLLLFGAGNEDADNAYNGGLYLARIDPDNNQWYGWSLRWIHTQQLVIQRDAPEADTNLYNLNSGLPLLPGDIVSFVVTHESATNRWCVYDMRGNLVKEWVPNPAWLAPGGEYETELANIGGTGTAKPTIVGARSDGAGTPVYSDFAGLEAYRVAWWESAALTQQQVRDYLNQHVWGDGTVYAGPAPTQEYDFTADGTASGATVTGGTVIDRFVESHAPDESLLEFAGLSSVNTTTYTATGAINGAGQKLIVVRSRGDTAISALTGPGISVDGTDSLVMIDTGSGASRVRTRAFLVNATGAGNLSFTMTGTTVFIAVAVYDGTNLSASPTTTATATDATLADTGISITPPAQTRLFTIGEFGGWAGGVDDEPAVRLYHAAHPDARFQIGSTSGAFIGSYIGNGVAELIRYKFDAGTLRVGHAFALPDSSLTLTAPLDAVVLGSSQFINTGIRIGL